MERHPAGKGRRVTGGPRGMGAAVVRRLAHAVVAVTCTSAKQNAEVVVVGTLGRHGCVDDMAGMVARLTRPEAAFVTGAGLSVDGGINT